MSNHRQTKMSEILLRDNEKACDTCGKVYTREEKKLHQAQWERTRYCSLECSWEGKKVDYPARVGSETKLCGRCGETKPLDLFPLRGKSAYGKARYGYCKPCHVLYQRSQRLKRLFALELGELEIIKDYQGGACAICGSEARLCVDHDHKTGLIRGALCFSCNRSLGWWRDDVERMQRAIDYLNDPPAPRALGRDVFGVIGRITNGKRKRRKTTRRVERP